MTFWQWLDKQDGPSLLVAIAILAWIVFLLAAGVIQYSHDLEMERIQATQGISDG